MFVKVVSQLLLLAGVVREITSHRKGFKPSFRARHIPSTVGNLMFSGTVSVII